MIANDIQDNVDWLAALLESEGYSVRTALGGPQCLEQVALEAPELLLLDVMMPVIDGLAIAKRLRSDPSVPHFPIVFVTGGHLSAATLTAVGVDGYLQKPLDIPVLLETIAQLLQARRRAAQ